MDNMSNLEYLNQISASNRTPGAKKGGFSLGNLNFSPTLVKVLIGGAILTVIMIIVGSILGGGSGAPKERDTLDRISLRSGYLITTIKDYNKQIKSSELRSIAASMSSALTETNSTINNILKDEYDAKSNKPDKESTGTDEEALYNELNETLENARLNGLLDRTFAREMAYQASMMESLESDVLARTKKQSLLDYLPKSMNNFNTLSSDFDNFTPYSSSNYREQTSL